jgi:glycine/D-amino acid oxidase-like deaminating enzyme
MRVVLTLLGALVTGALTAPFPVRAEIYKWVDNKGVAHYSNIKPPEGVKIVERFEEVPVSTVSAVPREQFARQRELALEARVEQLERDLYEARRANAMPVAPGYDPYYSGYASYYPGYYPAYGYAAYGYPISGVRTAHHFRHFPVGVRPVVRPLPVGGAVALRTAPARAMRH